MNERLMSDIGENYEYVRTIVNNKIEILKIDFAQNIAKSLGLIALSLLLVGMFFILTGIIMIAVAYFLAQLTGSVLLGLLFAGIILLVLCGILFLLRKQLIFNPVAKFFYSTIADKI